MKGFAVFLLVLVICTLHLTASQTTTSDSSVEFTTDEVITYNYDNIVEQTSENDIDLDYDGPSMVAIQGPPPVVFSAPQCPIYDQNSWAVHLPYPGNCSLFYTCVHGKPVEMTCPPGLHFNPSLSVCDWPSNANCKEGCLALGNDPNGIWSPSSCSADTNKLGTTCNLQCVQGYVLRGSAYIQCTPDGWNSSNGKHLPECVPTECIGEDLENELNKTLIEPANLVFVLDESGSVGKDNFELTKDFVKDVVTAFPLSNIRSAGVVTFASDSLVQIPMNEQNTANFMKAVDGVRYRSGGTNILDALNTAWNEMQNNQVHPLTLILLITDGESQTDGTPTANKIKAAGHPLFTIGVGRALAHLEYLSSQGSNGIKHFFHLQDYNLLKALGQYLNRPAGSGGSGSSSVCKSP